MTPATSYSCPLALRRLATLAALAMGAVGAVSALAQSTPPPLPPLTAEQSGRVSQVLALYRRDTEARVGRGEITPDEAELLIAWRHWQLSQQAAGQGPPLSTAPQGSRPPIAVAPDAGRSDRVAPYYAVPYAVPYYAAPYYAAPYYAAPYYAAPYYPAPYYAPSYGPPAPYYWGFSLCGGRGYRHGWASFCI